MDRGNIRADYAGDGTRQTETFNNLNISLHYEVLFRAIYTDGNSSFAVNALTGALFSRRAIGVDTDGDGFADTDDFDDDNDRVNDLDEDNNRKDMCPRGNTGWISNMATDNDGDGCRDETEDIDDDNDGVNDLDEDNNRKDMCPRGNTGWISNMATDNDGDGCRDETEDIDDDNDGVNDLDEDNNRKDMCPRGNTGWISNMATDNDGDGCRDETEDIDDDNDGVNDLDEDNNRKDMCPRGNTGWISNMATDNDGDGCRDETEDIDDDNDGVNDLDEDNNRKDMCPRGNTGWISNMATDNDGDGCRDETEDIDDDNDGVNDLDEDNNRKDMCPRGNTGWISNMATDNDGDGCRDETEDIDDDNDGVNDLDEDNNRKDMCPRGYIRWTSNPSTDNDGDGCRDATDEDMDDDNDGIVDTADNCQFMKNPLVMHPRFDGTVYQPDMDLDGIGDVCDGSTDMSNMVKMTQGALRASVLSIKQERMNESLNAVFGSILSLVYDNRTKTLRKTQMTDMLETRCGTGEGERKGVCDLFNATEVNMSSESEMTSYMLNKSSDNATLLNLRGYVMINGNMMMHIDPAAIHDHEIYVPDWGVHMPADGIYLRIPINMSNKETNHYLIGTTYETESERDNIQNMTAMQVKILEEYNQMSPRNPKYKTVESDKLFFQKVGYVGSNIVKHERWYYNDKPSINISAPAEEILSIANSCPVGDKIHENITIDIETDLSSYDCELVTVTERGGIVLRKYWNYLDSGSIKVSILDRSSTDTPVDKVEFFE